MTIMALAFDDWFQYFWTKCGFLTVLAALAITVKLC